MYLFFIFLFFFQILFFFVSHTIANQFVIGICVAVCVCVYVLCVKKRVYEIEKAHLTGDKSNIELFKVIWLDKRPCITCDIKNDGTNLVTADKQGRIYIFNLLKQTKLYDTDTMQYKYNMAKQLPGIIIFHVIFLFFIFYFFLLDFI